MKECKCSKCAELSGCYVGQHGGKEKCACYCPCCKAPKEEKKEDK